MRAFGLDVNQGGVVLFNKLTKISKFGHSYAYDETFAATLRVRNTECEGFRAWPYLSPPYHLTTNLTVGAETQIGEVEVRDRSQLYIQGAEISVVRVYDEGHLEIFAEDGSIYVDGTALPSQAPGSYSFDFEPGCNHLLDWDYTLASVTYSLSTRVQSKSPDAIIKYRIL